MSLDSALLSADFGPVAMLVFDQNPTGESGRIWIKQNDILERLLTPTTGSNQISLSWIYRAETLVRFAERR